MRAGAGPVLPAAGPMRPGVTLLPEVGRPLGAVLALLAGGLAGCAQDDASVPAGPRAVASERAIGESRQSTALPKPAASAADSGAALAGKWRGRYESPAYSGTLSGTVREDGMLRLATDDGVPVSGKLVAHGLLFDGTLRARLSGEEAHRISVKGVVDPGRSLRGSVAAPGHHGTFRLEYVGPPAPAPAAVR